jgi:transposase
LAGGKAAKKDGGLLEERWQRHDTGDAADVAHLISQGKPFQYNRPAGEIEKLPDLFSLRARLKK